MPWHAEAMKDAPACDKLRGAGKGRQSGDVRMGKPGWRSPTVTGGTHSPVKRTGGSETSQYPEERKSTETAGVAASETAPAQKGMKERG